MKVFIQCTIAWLLLITCIVMLFQYANNVNTEIQPPKDVFGRVDGTDLTINWKPADYATSYKIYRCANGTDDWELIATVASGSQKYIVNNYDSSYKYSVRTCNYSLEKFNYSDFSYVEFPQA